MRVRLHVETRLAPGATVVLAGAQSHYLRGVLRLKAGDRVRLFNGRDGEWDCLLAEIGKRECRAECQHKAAEPVPPPDIDYLFAPLKSARLDYLAQKATEMGVRRLVPVITERTVPQRVNVDRIRANAIEAAEQCNLVFVPEVLEPRPLGEVLAAWPGTRALVHCHEGMARSDPIATLRTLEAERLALLIGPEGGFSEREQALLGSLPFVTAVSLGPRIMRADTAAVAALALMQAVLGDWGAKGGG